MTAKGDRVFPVLQTWRVRRVLAVVLGLVAALVAAAGAVQGGGQGTGPWAAWGWGLFAALMLGLAIYNLLGLARQPWVVRLGPGGVEVCYATGRVVSAGWEEISAHTITPGGRIGALLLRSGTGAGGGKRVLPIPTRLIGVPATEALLAALKERLPGLDYRVPGAGQA